MPIRTESDEAPTPTALSRAARMHSLAKRSSLLEAIQAIGVAIEAVAEIEEASASRKTLDHERGKFRDLLAELPVYRPPEPGQGEAVDEELVERVREARAGAEDTP